MSEDFHLEPLPADTDTGDLLEALGPIEERPPESQYCVFRSRPLRKTQYCDSGGRSSIGPSASSRSPVSVSAGRGSRWKSSLIAFLWLRNYYANRRTARSRSSRVNGFVTYPSAPCCWPQYLSLAVSFEVTRITGIMLNSAFPFRSRQI